MKRRSYTFTSEWIIKAPQHKVWRALTATPFSWADWWPELVQLSDITISIRKAELKFKAVWQAVAGYRLGAYFTVVRYEYPTRIVFSALGDMTGQASWTFSPLDEDRTHILIHWQVQTTKFWMNLAAPVLRPLFTRSHCRIMLSGERGLNTYLS